MSGGRILDNQAKWRKLGYKGGETEQVTKKSDSTATSSGELNVKKVGEVRRTSESDIIRSSSEKNTASNVPSRLPELNGVRKELIIHEKRRRLSLADELELSLPGILFIKFN